MRKTGIRKCYCIASGRDDESLVEDNCDNKERMPSSQKLLGRKIYQGLVTA